MLFLIPFWSVGQQPAQNIKGRVMDRDTHLPLPGVNVIIPDSNPLIGTTTDSEGYYILPNVPIGRYSLQFSFVGYEPALFREISVGSAKEVVINVALKEKFRQLNEVVVKPSFRKDKPQNSMATVSARSFSIEEASRYAGGWNDPSRLAGSFAGVTMAEGVNDNAIVVRGNAPKGILWRVEGVEIPAPNHLNGVNNGGGIETVFSANMLDNSDFLTGAFPADYGNALSGAFDINFRNGNNTRRESSFQIGSQGIDISSEGPLNSRHTSSYLFNYRYSTMGLVGQLIAEDFGLPAYQDLSFKFFLPTPKTGTFSIWGVGGLSNVSFVPEEEPQKWTNTFDNNQYDTGSDVGAVGISHQISLKHKGYLKSSVAATYDQFKMKSDRLQRNGTKIPLADHRESNTCMVINTALNSRISNRLTGKTGINVTSLQYNLNIKGNTDPETEESLTLLSNQSDQTTYARAFSQIKWRLAPDFTLMPGINVSLFAMNQEWIVEPRMALSWNLSSKMSFQMAYGKHSRLEPLRFYQTQNEQGEALNPNLKVTKAEHYVFSFDYLIRDNLKLKIEPYYQSLFDVPVVDGTSQSLINYSWDMYFQKPLINKGTGTNRGVDITLERYMKGGFYYMFTGTLFDSKYRGADGIERNTSFNRRFVFNLLGGREWTLRKNNIVGINGKISWMGGNRFTPPDQEASRLHEMVILDESKAFEWQENNKLFVDIAFRYRINREGKAHVFSLQCKNALMQSEMFGWAYDFEKQKVIEHGITMVYPYFTYRVEF
ncbi:TonB-dependent receptor [Thermophagus sp. OGC60D27]|uniref:TonB-dependent receptor n=1 Tax=Thermophagus sp. OGC60D27 TaxID=3458415 RepID=UPI004037E52E